MNSNVKKQNGEQNHKIQHSRGGREGERELVNFGFQYSADGP